MNWLYVLQVMFFSLSLSGNKSPWRRSGLKSKSYKGRCTFVSLWLEHVGVMSRNIPKGECEKDLFSIQQVIQFHKAFNQSICQKIPKEKVTLLRFPCDMFKVEQRSLNYHICQRNLHIGEAGNKHFNLINVSNNGTEKLAICCVNYIDNYLKCLLLLSYLG